MNKKTLTTVIEEGSNSLTINWQPFYSIKTWRELLKEARKSPEDESWTWGTCEVNTNGESFVMDISYLFFDQEDKHYCVDFFQAADNGGYHGRWLRSVNIYAHVRSETALRKIVADIAWDALIVNRKELYSSLLGTME